MCNLAISLPLMDTRVINVALHCSFSLRKPWYATAGATHTYTQTAEYCNTEVTHVDLLDKGNATHANLSLNQEIQHNDFHRKGH